MFCNSSIHLVMKTTFLSVPGKLQQGGAWHISYQALEVFCTWGATRKAADVTCGRFTLCFVGWGHFSVPPVLGPSPQHCWEPLRHRTGFSWALENGAALASVSEKKFCWERFTGCILHPWDFLGVSTPCAPHLVCDRGAACHSKAQQSLPWAENEMGPSSKAAWGV